MPKGKSVHERERFIFLALLIETREKAGLTQAAVGAAANMSQPYVSQVEAGSIRMDVLRLRDWLHACGSNLERFGRALERRLGDTD